MPLSAPTSLYQKGSGGTQLDAHPNSVTTDSFTSVNNSLLIAIVNCTSQSVGAMNLPSTWTPDAGWTYRVGVRAHGSDAYGGVGVFTKNITTGSAMTLTVSNLGLSGSPRGNVDIYYVTGHDTSTPTGATATGTDQASGAKSITLSSAPASSGLVIAGLCDIPNGSGSLATAGSGWTSLYNDFDSTSNIDVQQQYLAGTTSTTVPWVAQESSDTIYDGSGLQWALEIIAAGGAETVTMDKWFQPDVFIPRRNQMIGY